MSEILVCIYYLGRHFLPQPLGFTSLPLAGELAFKMTSHSLFISGLLAKQLTLHKPGAQGWSSPEIDGLDGVQAKLGICRVPFLGLT